jgi:hypothetical protein
LKTHKSKQTFANLPVSGKHTQKTTKNMNLAKKYSVFLLILGLLSSCDKSYKYVETVQEESILGGTDTKDSEEKIIKAPNDSTAYLEAYKIFCISSKVSKDMKQSLGKTFSTPLSFKLYNDKEEDITNTTLFASRAKQEKEIERQISSMDNSIQRAVDENKKEETENFKKTVKIDSTKIKKLEKYFRKRKDEFSKTEKTWYEPKSAPTYVNKNALYCYFQTENGIPSNLRFRLQYYSDEWLFIEKVQFSIDGKAYEYMPSKTETDNGDGNIWEWFDESANASDKNLLTAISNAKKAKMKLLGRQYFEIKPITQDQILNIKRTVELYNAMGGKFENASH